MSPNLPPILGDFISYFLWRRERSKETSTSSKPPPIWGGFISYFLRREERSKAASTPSKPPPIWGGLTASWGKPPYVRILVWLSGFRPSGSPWLSTSLLAPPLGKGLTQPHERGTTRRRKCLLSGLVFLSELGFLSQLGSLSVLERCSILLCAATPSLPGEGPGERCIRSWLARRAQALRAIPNP